VVFVVFVGSIFIRKFRTQLKLETLDDAVVLSDVEDDLLGERHGCPVYASPEILSSQTSCKYSGRAADSWSLGVIIYTMLVGRYPFFDANPSSLLGKIRRCQFSTPSSISSATRLIINSLLQRDPEDRMTAEEVLESQIFTRRFIEDLMQRQQQSC
jgi:tribbles-like protein